MHFLVALGYFVLFLIVTRLIYQQQQNSRQIKKLQNDIKHYTDLVSQKINKND